MLPSAEHLPRHPAVARLVTRGHWLSLGVSVPTRHSGLAALSTLWVGRRPWELGLRPLMERRREGVPCGPGVQQAFRPRWGTAMTAPVHWWTPGALAGSPEGGGRAWFTRGWERRGREERREGRRSGQDVGPFPGEALKVSLGRFRGIQVAAVLGDVSTPMGPLSR